MVSVSLTLYHKAKTLKLGNLKPPKTRLLKAVQIQTKKFSQCYKSNNLPRNNQNSKVIGTTPDRVKDECLYLKLQIIWFDVQF